MRNLQAGHPAPTTATADPGPARPARPGEIIWAAEDPPAAGAELVVVDPPPDGFVEFQGMRALFEAVERRLHDEAPAAAGRLRDELDRLALIEAESRAPFSSAIVFAVVRRISRESHHSALVVDRLAACLVRALVDSAGLRRSTIVIRGFDAWDRPSLRTLAHAVRLGGHSLPGLTCLLAGLPSPCPEPASLGDRVRKARAQFLDTVQAALRPRLLGSFDDWRPPAEVPLDPEAARFAIARALSYQNYERVFLVAAPLLAGGRVEDADELGELWRLVAIAEVNLGWTDLGYRTLGKAAGLVRRPTLRAFLEYLQGLVSTKRFYDQERAERHYRAGLEILEASAATGDERALEEGWLLNGLALIRSLLAKTDPERADVLLGEAFELEMRAYRLVAGTKGPAFSYLRHNLLANLTFLLQISGRFSEAVQFWRRSFERFLAADNPAFQLGFDYRLGALLFRSGARQDGLAHLRGALEYAARAGDPFYEERVAYSLAWCLLEDCRPGEALQVFLRGMALADRLQLAQGYDEHVAGVLLTAERCGDEGRLRACCQLAAARSWSTWSDRCKRMSAAVGGLDVLPEEERPHLRPPSPKLPSYIPSIDMEGTPSTDLNRYLVMD